MRHKETRPWKIPSAQRTKRHKETQTTSLEIPSEQRENLADVREICYITQALFSPTQYQFCHTMYSRPMVEEPQGGRPRSLWHEKKAQQEEEANVRFQKPLSKDKQVTANVWNREMRIDLRVWEEDFKFPSKKGVSLPLTVWKNLVVNTDILSEALEKEERGYLTDKVSVHIGGGQYASVNTAYPCIDIRQFWLPEDAQEPMPTRKGIILKRSEWQELLSAIPKIAAAVPELAIVQRCVERDDHQNQLGALRCQECNPFRRGDDYD